MVKFTRRAMGHFVTLIEIAMHLITCISGHIYLQEVCVTVEPRLSGLVVTSVKSPDNRGPDNQGSTVLYN